MSAPVTKWRYRMNGNLDSANLQCSGSASVTEIGASAHPQCLHWRIVKQKCRGSRSVDWLHEDDATGEVCESAQGWELKKDLPGLAVCRPTVVRKNGRVVSVSVSCTWECRSASDPCAGQATYVFTQDP